MLIKQACIRPNKSTRNSIRTDQRGIILIKTLLKTRNTLVKTARDQLDPWPDRMKIFNASPGIYNYNFPLPGI